MKTLITIAVLSFIQFCSFAQSNCLIKYEYDASGNRIKRYYTCGVQDTIIRPPIPDAGAKLAKQTANQDIQFTVSPNPNNGNFYITSTAKHGTE